MDGVDMAFRARNNLCAEAQGRSPLIHDHEGESVQKLGNLHGSKNGSIVELADIPSDGVPRRVVALGPTPISPRRARMNERIQLFVLCAIMFLTGYNDGTTGPMLPRIQEVYNVRTTPGTVL